MLKIAWMFILGFFIEFKVNRQSELEGSSVFLSSFIMFYVLVSLLIGSFYCKVYCKL